MSDAPLSPPDSWNPAAADALLARLLAEYADHLRDLADVLPPGTADRFDAEVLAPLRATDPPVKWGPVRAVVPWPGWHPDSLPLTTRPAADELARLRDGLSDLLAELDATPRAGRWFGRDSTVSRLATPAAKALLTNCRDALAALARPVPPETAARMDRLRAAAERVDVLLDVAPPTWPPAAPSYAGRLFNLLRERPEGAAEFDALAPRLLDFPFESAGDPAAPGQAAGDAFATVVGAGSVATMPADRAAWLDQVLTCLRGWGAGFGVEFLPRGWSFVYPMSAADLRDGGAEVVPVYRPEEPVGCVVRVKQFGVAVDGEPVRPAVVTVSAGTAPVGLAELEAVVKDAASPPAEGLRGRLRDWRAASLDGVLEWAAVALHVDFWDRLRGELAAHDPVAAEAFADRLAVVLSDEFGLLSFHPANYQDRPAGWIQVADGWRLTTGRVREVLRPGLAECGVKLRVPARVAVE